MSDTFTTLDGITVDDIPVKFVAGNVLTDIDDVFVVDPTLSVSGAAADAKVTGDEIGALKEELTATSSEIGVYVSEFKSTGAAHSSNSDLIPVDIKSGESFSVSAMFDRFLSGYWQCFANYADGTNEAIFSYYPNQQYTTTASKDIIGIGIAVGAQTEAYTCRVAINSEQSVIKKIAANASDIADLKDNLKDAVVDLAPIVHSVTWERGRINSEGGNQDSTTYVRTVDYFETESFEYIHLAEKCQIEVFFYNVSSVKTGSKIYGNSSSTEQNVYLDYPASTTKIRIVQYMHNTSWSTTAEYAENDIKLETTSHIKSAISIANNAQAKIGKFIKIITVDAGANHSSTIEQDKIYINGNEDCQYIISVTSEKKASRAVQAWGYAADYSNRSLGSFYTDGKYHGISIDSDIVAVGLTIVNTASSVQDKFTVTLQSVDAITLDIAKNDYSKVIENARHIKGLNTIPLTLLHFSDLHADTSVLSRIAEAFTDLGVLADDAICTGDIVEDTAGQIASWWDARVLTCVGNHDCASKSGNVYNWTALSMADRDAYYIAPFESNWGIIHTSGTSYYYKDYTASNVRLIVMDAMLYNTNGAEATTQTDWLSNLLSDAITNDYHVLIAIHAPHGGATAKECSFSKYNQDTMPIYSDCNTPQTVIDAVATAITNGLHFVGYIVGHTHQDNIWDADSDGSQLMYCITCAAVEQPGMWKNSDQNRSAIADAYNVVTVDTENTLVKIVRGGGADIDDHMRTRKAICFNYSTGEKVGEVL